MPPFDAREQSRLLLDWNRRHLVAGAPLNQSDIAKCFASEFTVRANGRSHPANYATYLEFLNGFRATIRAIDYDVRETVADGSRVVLAMSAHITRVHGGHERFEAMLLLDFDVQGHVSLWHEVYVAT
ncbi:nuclear transport factor 2 family protein [Mycolicibacterium sp. J2]|uniref:nuclear transport factor 2 family protein n=1 Tax=Mycolicibacterium sp. J2 TaxID=2993511 RepID=UPI00224B08A3|nr:nuclear transport factor 2 family protein [Mycolicibacterium sp. J2]MCX2713149.1 hypothetical protein [Mycolicibacterium sp. J2]